MGYFALPNNFFPAALRSVILWQLNYKDDFQMSCTKQKVLIPLNLFFSELLIISGRHEVHC